MTKEEIKKEIDNLTKKIDTYKNELEKYKKSIKNLNDTINELNKGKERLENSRKGLKKSFIINDKTVDNGKIGSTINEMNTLANTLNKNIRDSINSKIEKLNTSISDAQKEKDELEKQYNTTE